MALPGAHWALGTGKGQRRLPPPRLPSPSPATSGGAGRTQLAEFAECTCPILKPTVSLAVGRVSPRPARDTSQAGQRSPRVCVCMRACVYTSAGMRLQEL